jgi:hypothetical protein
MAELIHFVVAVDLETGEVILDDDTLIARFHDGAVWDNEANEWRAETEAEYERSVEKIKPILDIR